MSLALLCVALAMLAAAQTMVLDSQRPLRVSLRQLLKQRSRYLLLR